MQAIDDIKFFIRQCRFKNFTIFKIDVAENIFYELSQDINNPFLYSSRNNDSWKNNLRVDEVRISKNKNFEPGYWEIQFEPKVTKEDAKLLAEDYVADHYEMTDDEKALGSINLNRYDKHIDMQIEKHWKWLSKRLPEDESTN